MGAIDWLEAIDLAAPRPGDGFQCRV